VNLLKCFGPTLASPCGECFNCFYYYCECLLIKTPSFKVKRYPVLVLLFWLTFRLSREISEEMARHGSTPLVIPATQEEGRNRKIEVQGQPGQKHGT
jgi:hypothetical protein